jgi:SpoVK/Ycf46/Vps4 family AAA+-type ATPase
MQKHFVMALSKAKPSVDQKQLSKYEEFTKQFGQEG